MSDIKNEAVGILRDAISEAKKEKIKNIWQKYKRKLTITFVTVIVIFLVFTVFGIYKKSKEEEYSALLQKAVMEVAKGNNESALEIVKNIHEDQNAPVNIKAISSLKYGAMVFNQGKFDDAIKIFLDVNKLKKADSYIRELAGLTALKALIDSNDIRYDDQIRSLTASLEKDSKLLKHFILEQKATFEWNRGNYKIANEIFHELANGKDSEVAESIKKRSADMVGIYNSKYASDEERKVIFEDESAGKIENKSDIKSDKK